MTNIKDMNRERFLTVDEASRWLNLSRRTIYTMISQGRIPYRKAGPRRVLFLESELLEWTKPDLSRNQYLELISR